MRQVSHGLALGLVCGAVLFLIWWFGPYGPRPAAAFGRVPGAFYWIWAGFFAFAFLISLLVAPFYRQVVIIADTEVIDETSLYWWRWRHRIARERALGIWTETIEGVDEGAMFPYRVHLLDAQGNVSSINFVLQRKGGVEQLLEALRVRLTLDVHDEKPLP